VRGFCLVNFQVVQGWLQPAEIIPSPNFDSRPEGCDVDLLVIHNISLPPGEYGGGEIQDFFCNTLDCQKHPYFETLIDLNVSSHLLIDRLGAVTQFVAFDQRAWHAGQSEYSGRQACNDFSVGIELEGVDDVEYSQAQYESLAAITNTLIGVFPKLTKQRIAGHNEIAPKRKTDPGEAFKWEQYLSAIDE